MQTPCARVAAAQVRFNKGVVVGSWGVASFTDPHRTEHELQARRFSHAPLQCA